MQTERVVDKDNTVAIRERLWQIDKTRFRNTLAGSTVTIHEHLDETVSIRYGRLRPLINLVVRTPSLLPCRSAARR